jgi:hypothetical protein
LLPRFVDSLLLFEVFGAGEAFNSLVLSNIVLEGLVVNSVGIVDTAVVFSHTDELGSFLSEVLAGPISHVSETLDDEGLSLKSNCSLKLLGNALIVEKLFGAGEDSQAGGLSPAADTELVEVLSSGHGITVDILVAIVSLVGRFHPTHLALASAYIGSRHIDSSSNGVLLSQPDRVLSSEGLQLSGGVLAGVDTDASLGASVGQVDDGALDGHEAGECFHFLNIHIFGVSGSALGGEFVGLMLTAVGGDGFE